MTTFDGGKLTSHVAHGNLPLMMQDTRRRDSLEDRNLLLDEVFVERCSVSFIAEAGMP